MLGWGLLNHPQGATSLAVSANLNCEQYLASL